MRPTDRWLILADDLTGAADCAIAFARTGLTASVAWSAAAPDDLVLALDVNSRRLAPAVAAARHRRLLERRHEHGVALFKKIDSTLRGQPAAELAETIRVLREARRGAFCVVAPAFPATGRTTQGGTIHLHGQKLEHSPLWARDHTYGSANLVAVLEAVGLRVQLTALSVVRRGPATLEGLVDGAIADGVDAMICDAELMSDLDIVAEATLQSSDRLFWTGSGGLAQALAEAAARRSGPTLPTPQRTARTPALGATHGILFVVGSVAEASRAAAALLRADGSLLTITVEPEILRRGPQHADWHALSGAIVQALTSGGDVLVEIASEAEVNLLLGADLAQRLGELLRPAASSIGALFATGGETALALLDALGVTGIQLIEEVEPGVPLGLTRGALAMPVITKAGAFGDRETLARCLSHLRALRGIASSSAGGGTLA